MAKRESSAPGTASECWLIDLDGVIWLSDQPIAGSAEAVGELRASGRRVAFFTNNSFTSHRDLCAKLERHGIKTSPEDVLSSAQAAAGLCRPDESAFVLGGHGAAEALVERGVRVLSLDELHDGARPDVVVVGLDRELTFARLTAASRAVSAGARLLGTNDDATYPTPEGPWPGGGSILAAVRYASGKEAVVAGKPYQPAIDLANERLGHVAVVVGDRPSTDGVLARGLGAAYGLVRSGVVPPGAPLEGPAPELDFPDLAELVTSVLKGRD